LDEGAADTRCEQLPASLRVGALTVGSRSIPLARRCGRTAVCWSGASGSRRRDLWAARSATGVKRPCSRPGRRRRWVRWRRSA